MRSLRLGLGFFRRMMGFGGVPPVTDNVLGQEDGFALAQEDGSLIMVTE